MCALEHLEHRLVGWTMGSTGWSSGNIHAGLGGQTSTAEVYGRRILPVRI